MPKSVIYSMKLHLTKEEYPNRFLKSDLRLICGILANDEVKVAKKVLHKTLLNMGYTSVEMDTIAERLNKLKNVMMREPAGELI